MALCTSACCSGWLSEGLRFSIIGTSVGALIGAIYAFNRSEIFGDLPMKELQMRAGAAEQLCIASDFSKFRDIN